MAEGPLKTFLVPLGQALIGASRESVEAAITNDIASSESAIASFVAATTADACLLMGVDDGAVAFSRNFSPLPERFVAVGRSAASGAALSSIIEEYGDSTDLGEHCAVVLSGRGGTHGQTETLAVARQLLRAAVRPLVAEASSGGTEAEEAMAPRLVAVAQRLGDLEAALGRCDRRARLAEATLAPPAAVERFLEGGGSGDDVGGALDGDGALADECAAAVAAWAKDAHDLVGLCEGRDEDASPLAFPPGRDADAVHGEMALWREYEAALRAAGDSRRSPGGRAVAHVLKRAKRFVAAAQLEDGVAAPLARSLEVAVDANKVLRDLPVAPVEGAATLDDLAAAATDFFQHLAKLRASRHYAPSRGARLVEAASDAVGRSAMRLLDDGAGALLADEDAEAADRCFAAARGGVRKFRELALELMRRGGGSAAAGDMRRVANLELFHEKVEARLGELRKFKADHHKFRGVLATVLAKREAAGDDRSATSALGELDGAYERFLSEVRGAGGACDATFDGDARHRAASDDYFRRLDRAENMAAAQLAAELEAAATADETFAVFATFQPLLDRPAVRRAAQRHQAELVDTVKRDVDGLKDACTKRYEGSNAAVVASLRDLPPLGGKILWARQMERRLHAQMARLSDVLGGDRAMERHPRGRALRTVADELLRHLDATPLFEEWLGTWKRATAASARAESELRGQLLLHVDVVGDARALVVNFDEDRVELFKEVKHLRWLGFKVPETIALLADEARDRYPAATALRAAVRGYGVARRLVDPADDGLLGPWLRAIRDRVARVFPRGTADAPRFPKLAWSSPTANVRAWVDAFAEDVSALQEKFDVLRDARRRCDAAIATLETSDGFDDVHALDGAQEELQAVVDRLSLEGFHDLEDWTRAMDRRALRALRARCVDRLKRWALALDGRPVVVDAAGDRSEADVDVGCRRSLHKIAARDGRLRLEPGVDAARAGFHGQLRDVVGACARLPRLRASRFDALTGAGDDAAGFAAAGALTARKKKRGDSQEPLDDAEAYGDALFDEDTGDGSLETLHGAYAAALEAAGRRADDARDRFARWRRHDLLWASTVSEVARAVDDAYPAPAPGDAGALLDAWRGLLEDAVAARHDADADFAFEEERRGQAEAASLAIPAKVRRRRDDDLWADFAADGDASCAVVFDARAAHASLRSRFEGWLRELRREAGKRAWDAARAVFDAATAARERLDALDERRCSCRDALQALALYEELVKQVPAWRATCAAVGAVEATLKAQRVDLDALARSLEDDAEVDLDYRGGAASRWLEASLVAGAVDATAQILERKKGRLDGEKLALRAEADAEIAKAAHVAERLATFWAETKPERLDLAGGGEKTAAASPSEALERLGGVLEQVDKALRDGRDFAVALAALGDAGGAPPSAAGDLEAIRREAVALGDVWRALEAPVAACAALDDARWADFDAKAARGALRQADEALRTAPAKVRQYAAHADAVRVVEARERAVGGWVGELRNAANLGDRHWAKLAGPLFGGRAPELRTLRVGALLRLELGDAARKEVEAVLASARNDAALSQFLDEVDAHWAGATFDVAPGPLIRGWEPLFEKLDEHGTALCAMKDSPAFRPHLEARSPLCKRRQGLAEEGDELRRRLELWADAQRRWVGLGAIFGGGNGGAAVAERLPAAAAKFADADRAFARCRRDLLAKAPAAVRALLESEKLPGTLEHVAAALGDAQRALGDYLEMQRGAFARFYFVGDDDLLSILGGGDDSAARVGPHLSKMFAAVSAVDAADGGARMASFDGEVVPLGVALEDRDAIKWLVKVERAMRVAVAAATRTALAGVDGDDVDGWLAATPTQAAVLATQISWAAAMDAAVAAGDLAGPAAAIAAKLETLAAAVVADAGGGDLALRRRKREQLIVEVAQQRDATAALGACGEHTAFEWARQLRFYAVDPAGAGLAGRLAGPGAALVEGEAFAEEMAQSGVALAVAGRLGDAAVSFGFEYTGVGARLVRTALTDRCFETMAAALKQRLGGNPVGPAGTGKTESVRALGSNLGRHVVVFNCDEAFDLGAMGRLLKGLCRSGAWGCFDEFNRLDEGMLSAVSEQLEAIQNALLARNACVDFGGPRGDGVPLRPTTGVFVTMNPGYAGRSPLPENLKQLFRTVAMVRPDSRAIATTALYAKGFEAGAAGRLARGLVSLLELCATKLSSQSHYEWGLRAIGPVLARAGLFFGRDARDVQGDEKAKDAMLASLDATVTPRLVAVDVDPFSKLVTAVFGAAGAAADALADDFTPRDALADGASPAALGAAFAAALRAAAGVEAPAKTWVDKALQLRSVLSLSTGAVVVGGAGVGKSTLISCVLKGLEALDGVAGVAYVVDPKALVAPNYKELLFGRLDATTLEWTDGLFTAVVRAVRANDFGELRKRHWIVFDGDVDPEWAENLNSVLDDNKTLTLPNGERLAIPPVVKLLFEVEDLSRATPATVSRCGVLHVDADVVPLGDRAKAALAKIAAADADYAAAVAPLFAAGHAVEAAVAFAFQDAAGELMPAVAAAQPLGSLAALCAAAARDGRARGLDPASAAGAAYARRSAYCAAFWACGGGDGEDRRAALSAALEPFVAATGDKPASSSGALCYDVRATTSKRGDLDASSFWEDWEASVPAAPRVDGPKALDAVVATADTLRHEALVDALASSGLGDGDAGTCSLLCGPPGSGKTMTCAHALGGRGDAFHLAPLACSSGTSASEVAVLLAEHCELVRGPRSTWSLEPKRALHGDKKTLVVFCDEINLVAPDAYGTPRALAFLRQLVERRGFWALSLTSAKAALEPSKYARTNSGRCPPKWVALKRVSFVAACNPPTDAGRHPLPERLLRHLHVLRVGTPRRASLERVYAAYCDFAGRDAPSSEACDAVKAALHVAMLDVFEANADRFVKTKMPQCVYSARELTRWCRALRAAYDGGGADHDGLSPAASLVRVWAHEGLRLFADRLPSPEDVDWCADALDAAAAARFPAAALDRGRALRRPLLFSRWLSRSYAPAKMRDLKSFVTSRLRTFYEEELDVPLVVYDDVVAHVLRIDAVLRAESGHLLLVGESGVGKSVLTKFVAWNNGLSLHEVQATRHYTLAKFDDELRGVMRRAGVDRERMVLVIDEADGVSSAFLERMNALLASGEVPGLWGVDDTQRLLAGCREAMRAEGPGGDDAADDAAILDWFARNVRRNLHVVFTLNPGCDPTSLTRRATASPALFNRCVVDWFGAWSPQTLAQVSGALLRQVDFGAVGAVDWEARRGALGADARAACDLKLKAALAADGPVGGGGDDSDDDDDLEAPAPSLRHAAVAALVGAHAAAKARRREVSARDFVELARCFARECEARRSRLEGAQRRKTAGLRELAKARQSVAAMQGDLKAQNEQLETQEAIGREQLEKMVVDQQQAERKQAQGAVLQKELQARTGDIEERKKTAEAELAEAEPALIRAREAVSGIKKSQLDELRSLRNPPPNVKRTLEAVQILLGLLPLQASYSWDDVRKAMRKSDFIATVVGFSPSDIEDSNAKMVNDRYLKPSDAYLEKVNAKERDEKGDDAKEIVALDYDIVQRSSQAAGPLVLWASSQLSYCEIERKVEPLKQEVEKLESETKETRELVDALQKELEALAKSVAGYKDAYAAAVREGERIKADIDAGKTKAERAVRLLASLADEQDRWQEEAATFPETMQLVPYRALVAAANVAYCGPLSEGDRVAFQAAVRDAARGLHLVVDDEAGAYSLGGAVSRATARDWHETHGLPRDARFVANAAMLLGSKRCALLVDPSGGALRFVESLHAAARVAVVSAADASFEKTLATAARFGTALVVRDVDEAWDSAAHPLLNREFAKRGGGKAGVKLGGDFVEVSPDFTLVLHARSRAAADELPLGLLGRVALLDFSATAESLQATALSRFLRAERPALERDRVDAAKDLDAQRARLLALETDVLERITSSSEGEASLLDDDVALRALEAAKAEALEARAAARDIEASIEKLRAASDDFEAAAAFAADVYGVLARLVELHDAYAVSLDEFLDGALHAALAATAPPPPGAEAPAARFARLAAPLVAQVSRRVGRALLSREHKVAASLALAALYADRAGDPALSERAVAFLAAPPAPGDTSLKAAQVRSAVGAGDVDAIAALLELPELRGADAAALGAAAVAGGDAAVREAASPALALLACKAFRPDRVLDAADALVENVLGSDAADAWRGGAGGGGVESIAGSAADDAARLGAFGDAKERRKQERKRRRSAGSLGKEDDLEVADGDRQQALDALAVEADGDALAAPVALVVAERNGGRDAAEEVEAAARSLGVVVEAVAMGAAASERRSRDLLRRGADAGCWVVFRNAHLASEAWLLGLEKALRGLRPAPGFRVVLTAEVAVGEPSRLPGRLVARAAVVALGADVGLRAALLRHEALLTQRDAEKGGAAWDRGPVERRRVHALLAVAHAVVTERARYSDAFTKPYEWGDVDAKCALEAADAAVDGLNAGDHAAPEDLPWPALAGGAFYATYGARAERDSDARALRAVGERVVSLEAFSATQRGPTPGGACPPLPDGAALDRDSWRAWIAALPRATPCDWLGLAPAADVRRAHDALQRFLGGLAALRGLGGAGAAVSVSRDAGAARRLRDALQTAKLAAAAELGAPVDDLELAAAAGGLELSVDARGAALVDGSLDATAASGAPAALAVAWRPKQAPGPASALAPLRAGGDHVADVRLDAAPSAADAYLRNATLHFVGGV